MTYNFDLLPVAREQLDILESLLRDAYDEINDLKNQLSQRAATPLISLRSSTACSNSRNVLWDQPYNNTHPKYFELSRHRTTICVKQAGVYQVNVRLTGNGQHQAVSLRSNGTVIASTTFSHNITANITTAINDIFNLEAESRLQVLYAGNGATTTDPTFSQFSIIKLA